MIVVAVLALTVFHPGYCFPQLAGQQGRKASLEPEYLHENEAEVAESKV